MTTAIESAMLLDLISTDALRRTSAKVALDNALGQGQVVACDIVWAEVTSHCTSSNEFSNLIGATPVRFDPISAKTAWVAGAAWKEFRRSASGRREWIAADFMVAAHADQQADGLLALPRGFHRRYFKTLHLAPPSRMSSR